MIALVFFIAGMVAASIFWASVMRRWVNQKIEVAFGKEWRIEMQRREREANPPMWGPSPLEPFIRLEFIRELFNRRGR